MEWLKWQNSVPQRTIPTTAFVFTLTACHMITHFLNIRWNFIMLGICWELTIDTFFISIHYPWTLKSSHSFTIMWQDQTMSLIVKRFPKTHIPSHSFTEGLSGLSALSFSPPFLPPLIVLLNCLAETCRIRAHLQYFHIKRWGITTGVTGGKFS